MQQMINFIFVTSLKKLRRRLTLSERIIIQTLLGENNSKSYIAIQLNRDRPTITRQAIN
jgi:IS30 family transposase